MIKLVVIMALFLLVLPCAAAAQQKFQTDVIKTSAGDLKITFIGHGTLMFEFGGKIVHVDPWTKLADYTRLPKADLVLITHEHRDHLDTAAIDQIRTDRTKIVLTEICSKQVSGGQVMANGDEATVDGLKIEAVPAYNIVHMRGPDQPFHPQGAGNGYIVAFGDKRVYIAGDTENTPEMKALKNIDVAFLPVNLPYTMTPEMFADAARAMKPKILYPYHYSDTDMSRIQELVKDVEGVELRIRPMN